MHRRVAQGVTQHRGCGLSWSVEGVGPPVVLIQGVNVAGSGWRPQVEGLGGRFRCLSFDNRGMAASQPPGDRLTVDLMVEDTLRLMDAQGWNGAHLVGHSLGGFVALHAALAAPERVRSLSLLCTFASGKVPLRMSWWMLGVGVRSRIGARRKRRRAFLEVVLSPQELRSAPDLDALADRVGELFGHDLADQPPIVMRQLRAMAGVDATAELGRLAAVPTLVVSAEHDRIAPPAAGRTLAARIPGARYVQVQGSAHGVVLTRPEEVNGLLAEHMDAAEREAAAQG